MTIPDPPWKRKTRPCPFYSQGRCLFSDSCSFLHDVKIKVKNPEITIISSPTPESTPTLSRNDSVASSPASPSTVVQVRSPPRSPRLSSLLLALGNAIEQEKDGEVEEVPTGEAGSSLPADLLPEDAMLGQVSRRRSTASMNGEGISNVGGEVDGAALDSSDSEGHDEATAQGPHTPPVSQDSAQEQVVSNELMSPVELTMAPPFWHPIGQLPQSLHREDSVDSGYADNWTGPTPFTLSPPHKDVTKRFSTLSLLSSPFGSPARAISPKVGPTTVSGWPSSPRFNSNSSNPDTFTENDVSVISLDELDSPTAYAARRHSGASQISEADPESTVKQSSLAYLHDEQPPPLPSIPAKEPRESTSPAPRMSESKDTSSPSPISPLPAALASPLQSEVAPSPVFSLPPTPPSASSSPENPQTRSPAPVSESTDEGVDTEEDESALYGSYYQEVPMDDDSFHSTPGSIRALSRSASLRSSVRRTPSVLPSSVTSPTPSTASTSSLSLLKPPARSITIPPLSIEPPEGESPQIALVDNIQDVRADRSISRDGPLSADWPRGSRSVSPYSSNSPITPFSEPAGSPSSSTHPSVSDAPTAGEPSSRRSSKVPFGFRNSMTARKRESLNTPRPGSAPPIRHRPPALVGIESNRSNSLNDSRLVLVSPTESSSSASKLRPLRLSTLLSASSSSLSFNSAISPSPLSSGMFPAQTAEITPATSQPPRSPSVHADYSLSNKPHLSPASPHHIPSNSPASTLIPSDTALTLDGPDRLHSRSPTLSASSASWTRAPSPSTSYASHRLSHLNRPSSRLSEPILPIPEDDREEFDDDDFDEPDQSDLTIRGQSVSSAPPYVRPSSAASFVQEPVHAIATPRPTLLFAIASDNVDEVRRVLESGEAGPNDDVGPQSALAFALTANNLKHKTDIVKLLLAHGANPSSLRSSSGHGAGRSSVSSFGQATGADAGRADIFANVDPATRYYIARADAPQTRRASSLIHRSFFRPLSKVRYDLVGQDRALEQLFRVLSMPTMAPIVVLLCGPSGHGKSLLARRFGSLLDVPTHTVNMTTLRSTRDIWKSYSMSPYEAPSDLTLADFLMENEGKRCVVVLDEIEKTENETILSSLLMPWELGRCSFEAGHRHVDCSKVIWLGTSNIGHDMVFEHQASRASPDEQMSREEYVDFMKILRPVVSERLGPSLLSRVTTVLPFVPFTTEERMAIASEALFALAEDARTIPAATVEKLVKDSLQSYVPAEGARSLYRAVSTLLLDTL